MPGYVSLCAEPPRPGGAAEPSRTQQTPESGDARHNALMGILTVGAATLLLGQPIIGQSAVVIDWLLWSVGTVLGLACAAVIPHLLFVRLGVQSADAFGGWLMPVVPPMVSAATGALLIPHLPPGSPRVALLFACYAMFGLALVASMVLIPSIVRRAALGGAAIGALAPTAWIVLGPVGQSITAGNLLGHAAQGAVAAPGAA
mgnify:CR=1 FL=1